MRVGDVSRARRFANPARLRWYAFHRSVRFALRMMKAEDAASPTEAAQLQLIALPEDIGPCRELALGPGFNHESFELKANSSGHGPATDGPTDPEHALPCEPC